METFIAFVFIVLLIPVQGWVVQQGWRWFVEPIGIPTPGVAVLCGLSVLLNFILPTRSTEKLTIGQQAARRAIECLIVLIVMAIISLFR